MFLGWQNEDGFKPEKMPSSYPYNGQPLNSPISTSAKAPKGNRSQRRVKTEWKKHLQDDGKGRISPNQHPPGVDSNPYGKFPLRMKMRQISQGSVIMKKVMRMPVLFLGLWLACMIRLDATPPEGALVQGSDDSIYLIQGGEKHHIMGMDVFNGRGFNMSNVQKLTDADLHAIPIGDDLAAADDDYSGAGITATFDTSLTRGLALGKPEVIYPEAMMPYTMDGSWATLREDDGSLTFFETAMAKPPYYFRNSGTLDDPLRKKLAPFVLDYNGYNKSWASGCWINNIYKHADGTLIGFVHREDLFPSNGRKDHGNNFFIGIAKSTDDGLHWKYLGDVLANPGNGATTDGWCNMGGVPYLVVHDFLYIYYNEHAGPKASDSRFLSVARAKIDDVLAAAVQDQVPRFKKYADGGWTEDGITGMGSAIIPNSGCRNDDPARYDFHSDATYCKPLGCYLITVQTHALHKLLLYASQDGVDWRLAAQLDYAPGCMMPYSSFVSFDPDDAADGHEVGREFYIYYPRKKLSNYNDDTLCRIKCSVGR